MEEVYILIHVNLSWKKNVNLRGGSYHESFHELPWGLSLKASVGVNYYIFFLLYYSPQ